MIFEAASKNLTDFSLITTKTNVYKWRETFWRELLSGQSNLLVMIMLDAFMD